MIILHIMSMISILLLENHITMCRKRRGTGNTKYTYRRIQYMSTRQRLYILLIATAVTITPLSAQQIDIQGLVSDSANGLALSGAVVSLIVSGIEDTTGGDGVFQLTASTPIRSANTPVNQSRQLKIGPRNLLTYANPVVQQLRVSVVSLQGRCIEILYDGVAAARRLSFRSNRTVSGHYFYEVQTAQQQYYLPFVITSHDALSAASSSNDVDRGGTTLAKKGAAHARQGDTFTDTVRVEMSGYATARIPVTQRQIADLQIACRQIRIIVTQPKTKVSWEQESRNYIKWESVVVEGTVDIFLFKQNLKYADIVLETENDGEYRWTVPESIEPYDYYDIRVQSHDDKSVYGELKGSDVVKITPSPYIEVTSPYASSRWGNGYRKTISWEHYGAGSEVVIELWKGSSKEKTISTGTNNDGSYSWEVSTKYVCNSCYRMKVISASSSSIFDFSPNFSISF
ncbi:MAG: hypothetical protein GF398_17210 [Chitinivibrionales bacterium]|nr:hypothetical protein [Chitinivibrionales bacterium]